MDAGIVSIILIAIVLVIAIGFHEYAHAWVSYKFGDPTPKLQGRLTPNPLKHLDPIGFLMIFLIHFGWGKPVEVNPMYYKNKLRDELLVALAGPFANLLMSVIGAFIYLLLLKINFSNPLIDNFFQLFVYINIALAIFNLLPIYPLDGYRIIKFLKPDWAYFMEKNGWIFMIILLLLVFAPGNFIGNLINAVVQPLYNLIFSLLSFVIF